MTHLMSILRNIAGAVLVVSLLTFVALFGRLPALRKTPVGALHVLLCVSLPRTLSKIDTALTNGMLTQRGQRLGHYLFYQKNPIVLLLFLGLLTSSAGLFLWNAVHLLSNRLLLPLSILLPLPYIFTYLCVTHTAHHITVDNHAARMYDYPYDHILFRPQTACRTCNLIKPARSKHCSLCGVCVAKCDHHCPWVNTCLGLGNYRHFLALLLSLAILQIYGAFLAWSILRPYFHLSLATALFSRARLDELGHGIVMAVNRGGISIAGVGLLAAATPCLPLGLLAYHCYLIWAGMTTNESQKWSDWKDDVADGLVFRANRVDLDSHNRSRKYDRISFNQNPALSFSSDDEAPVYWPISSEDILVATQDGKPPHGQEALWTQIWSLDEVVNIYDLGAMDNYLEVLKGR